MKINIPDEFSNDAIYRCSGCNEGIMCFSMNGSTDFCPCCGERNMGFNEYKEEE